MKRCLIYAVLLLLPVVLAAQDEPDDFGIWSSVDVTKSLGDKWSVGLRGEYRSCEMSRTTNLWFVRATAGYKPLNWLKLNLWYDFFWKPAGYQHRAIFDVTGTLKRENFTCSLRERFIGSYAPETDAWGWLWRTKLTAKYRIGETPFAPYLAYELYVNKGGWQQSHHFVGCNFIFDSHSTVDLFYAYNASVSKNHQDHILGVGYFLKF